MDVQNTAVLVMPWKNVPIYLSEKNQHNRNEGKGRETYADTDVLLLTTSQGMLASFGTSHS